MAGRVYLVGAGPGNPGLITVRGMQLLARAQVLVFDSPCDSRLLEAVPPSAERIAVGRWPAGAERPSLAQGEIQRILVDRARAGKCVVRLKSGDPSIFARGAEECAALNEAGIDYEVVPGVTAALGAAAFAGIPISEKGIASTVVLAIAQQGARSSDFGLDLSSLASAPGTLAIYLDPKDIPALAAELIKRGRAPSTPAAVVAAATLAAQQVVEAPLNEIGQRAQTLSAPTLLFLGEAVGQRGRFDWLVRRPLHGRTIVLTRAKGQSAELVAELEEQGAEVLELPCLEIAPPESWEALDRAIASLDQFDWVVLSSANGVESLLARLEAAGKDARALATAKIAVVGEATAEALRKAHLRADLVPGEFNSEGLLAELARRGVSGKRFLIVRAVEGRELLPAELAKLGAHVELVAAYRSIRPAADVSAVRERARQGRLSSVVFASPSAVRNFVEHFDPREALEILKATRIAVIGPTSARAVESLGLAVAILPEQATMESLARALIDRLGAAG